MTSDAPKILLIDDEKSMREFLSILFEKEGYIPVSSASGHDAVARLSGQEFDVVVTDLNLPDLDGIGVLREARHLQPETPVLMITAYATTQTAIDALKLGAYDYVMKPFNVEELKNIVAHAVEKKRLTRENIHMRRQLKSGDRLGGMIGISEQMQQVFSLIKQVAPTQSNILVTGESGTGKELVARAIHQHSARFAKPFVSINCAALPADLLESELFGHVKGSFTGASVNKKGLFETAHSGTLLLDEIGEMSPEMQVKLLRALQERSIRRIGGLDEIRIDVRLISTTNRDLQQMVEEAQFRDDLFYRINVIHIHLPPLRERREDIPLLVDHFIARLNQETGRKVKGVSQEALRLMKSYHWPGNIRELENVMERAMALETGEKILSERLPEFEGGGGDEQLSPPVSSLPETGFVMEQYLRQIEKRCIRQALHQAQGNMTRAAGLLGMSFRSFRYYVKKYGLKNGDQESAAPEERAGGNG